MTWYFHNTGEEFTEEYIENYFGYVYCITDVQTGKKYIGKKFFTRSKTKQVKGKKKKIRVSSDWMKYWGSNEELKKDVLEKGEERFVREILHLCRTRSECSYYETYEIFSRHALLSDNYYNEWVSTKIRASHLKGLQMHISGNTSIDL